MSATVLVVDDQENMCWILSKVLSDAGFSVETANTAGKARCIASMREVSVVITDYRLPDGNGFDLFLDLRKGNGRLPCVLITSYGSRELREKALKLGFDAYFDKPFDNDALLNALKEVLKK